MWSLFGCGKKATASKEAQIWLDKNFPGQFLVQSSKYAENLWISSNYSDFKVSVMDKTDPDIQFIFLWRIKTVDGATSAGMVKKTYESAKNDIYLSRALLAHLKKSEGPKTAVGITALEGEEYLVNIMLFVNPEPVEREQILLNVQKKLLQWPLHKQAVVWIFFMEENYFGKDFQELIPPKYVQNKVDANQPECMYSYQDEAFITKSIDSIQRQLTINTGGHFALGTCMPHAFEQAKVWSQTHQKPAVFLRENGATIEVNDHDNLALNFSFPYFLSAEAAAAEPKIEEKIEGYISGTYQVDQKTLSKISGMKNF